ncbi:PREDICTED: uncharacterized protein LOC109339946 [Lupinus angustifolius]|uniref:uncharacterized protein LOC109339946 n=1 Tax=Lupinus angustifolius TaxID=3871 RepID=UPI00092E85F4|nr:PREDICTED: uncharacterized protein LOC109339946 [Lupinus angustifolius]
MENRIINPNPILDPSGPYFISPTENPGSSLVSHLLNGDNYHPWSRDITMALETKDKLEFIYGTLPIPPNHDPIFTAWRRCNNLVVSWITQSIDPAIVQSQGSSSVSVYFTQMKRLWQQLDSFKPIPPCNCNEACISIPTVQKYRQNDYVICFLKGLNEQFSTFEDPRILSNFSESKNYSQNNNDARIRGRGRGFRGQNGGRSQGPTKPLNTGRGMGQKVCTYCQKTRHTIEVCYKKHGFPPNYFTSRTCNINTCGFNDNEEHTVGEGNDYTLDNTIKDNSLSSNLTFTAEQHKALVSMFQQSKAQNNNNVNHVTSDTGFHNQLDNRISGTILNSYNTSNIGSWILDSGATDHVCHSLLEFQTFRKIKPITITLPNSSEILAHYSGSIMF